MTQEASPPTNTKFEHSKYVLKDDRLIVEGVQMVKKHVRATQQGQQSGIVSVEAPIHRSNVMLI
ncbi:MAG: 50S ribosomal protein L24, partial [Bacteroidaceae bacterium]|nr:50S ribosomal protein L24 [Bacteroidaceae bacterium]